ncbi:hypothetical protein GCM10023093_11930 [Nemorincola caseinilytica]|uniref:CHAT domain-containing protein n=1 Tax=Nemorincola caseinilytica TaxID=2054315 RepID=A0ABP8NB14_9BACT
MRIAGLVWLLLVCAVAYGQQPSQDTLKRVVRSVAAPKKKPWKTDPYLQDTLMGPIPLARALFHEKIDNEQRRADEADGRTDGRIIVPGPVVFSGMYTDALLKRVDRLQIMVENMPPVGRDSAVANQQKIQCLRGIWELMRQYSADPRPRASFYDSLVDNMRSLIVASNEHKTYDLVMANPDVYTLDNGRVLLNDEPNARAYIHTAMASRDPVMMARRLQEFSRDTFAITIVNAAARQDPRLIFSYALSSDILLKGTVYRSHDPFVQAIVQTSAESEAPLRALPFISYLYTGRGTIDAIDTIAADPARSFNALVALRMSNEPLSRQLYTEELEYRALKDFVRQMNELHDTTDDVRFRCVDSLSAASLFYIMVYGREEIYTSSFLGTFKRMVARMAPMRGDQLLDTLHHDHFRTFIRLCASYNTLTELLNTMDDTARTSLMSRFISGLQKGPENDLEDAVNVADAIGSINDTALLKFLRVRIAENYRKSQVLESRKGMAIYNLLGMLAESASGAGTDAGASTASNKLKLPPINIVPFRTLTDDTGTIHERVFFYGDEDGMNAYAGFMDDHRKNKQWKVDSNKYWVTITSLTGKRVVLYANMPLRAPEDEKAIDTLDMYLATNNIRPTVVIHRGHSYHVKTTLMRIDSNARVVVLGSCGGYQNVAKVLRSSPGAHIISSKQTGVGAINEPMSRAINTILQEGNDINWIPLWAGLDQYFSKNADLYPRFKDYVPPHKNLGVLFIKAYGQLMGRR